MEIVIGILLFAAAIKWVGMLNPLNSGCGCIVIFVPVILGLLIFG